MRNQSRTLSIDSTHPYLLSCVFLRCTTPTSRRLGLTTICWINKINSYWILNCRRREKKGDRSEMTKHPQLIGNQCFSFSPYDHVKGGGVEESGGLTLIVPRSLYTEEKWEADLLVCGIVSDVVFLMILQTLDLMGGGDDNTHSTPYNPCLWIWKDFHMYGVRELGVSSSL